MKKSNNKPELRFLGNTDEWEQRKFNDVFDFMQNNALSRAELSCDRGEVLNVHYGDILVKYGEVLDVERDELTCLLDSTLINKYQSSLLQNGDVIIADAAEDETVGKCSEIAGLTTEKVLSGLHTIPCRPRMNFGEGYLGYYMNSRAYHDQLLPLIQGTKISSISKSAIQDTDILYPKSEQEQVMIGTYFSNLDHLITLHQCKYDKLKKLKRSMLQKMFPQNGSLFPEIRFEEFSDAWEQRKLSDEFSNFIVPMRDKPKEFGGSIPWTRIEDIEGKYLNGTLSDQYVTEETVQSMNLKIIPKNSLIVSSSATFGVVAVVTQDLITNQTFIGLVPNEKETLDYWYTYFHSNEARNYMRLQSAGSTIFYIARESFENMPISVPSKKEMIKIGQYFENLDHLITLHQRKMEILINIKKVCMDKMFV